MSPNEKPEGESGVGKGGWIHCPWKFWTAIVCLCTLLAGIFWWMNRTLQSGARAAEPLPRYLRVVETLQAVERDGREVSSASLDGKVRLFACLYTVCPHGCAAVMGQMKKLHEAHGNRPDFQQVSITVVPDRDTPEMLTAFAEGMGAGQSSSWWFLTGRQSALWDFMSKGWAWPRRCPSRRMNGSTRWTCMRMICASCWWIARVEFVVITKSSIPSRR